MADSLLVTKISLPLLRQALVPRDHVLRRLAGAIQDNYLLVLVSAPAGYGKTTTIRMWVEQAGCSVAWLTLEKSDNDLKQFMTYLLAALGRAVEHLGESALEAVVSAREVNLPAALSLLINELHALDQPVILVLEEYHLIENEDIDRALEFLLNQAVANLRLVIATREDPDLPLTRLRARNQLIEIRAADLSFSLEEAGAFFSKVMGVHLLKRETEILKNRTEGWAAGLQLAALSLRDSRDAAGFVESFGGTHRHILDYLIEETLNSQPEEMQDFLRRTAILDQLSPALCDAVTGHSAGRRYLHYLEHNNLFLVSLDEERTWYRYHGLFRELLKNQLAQVEPALIDDLHERAAEWYERSGFIQKAIEHAFQMSTGRKVAQLIERHALPMIYQGEVSTVMGWFDRMPDPLTQSSPMLLIARAWSLALMQRQGMRTGEVTQALAAAGDALERVKADDALRNLVGGHAATIQAFVMNAPGSKHRRPERFIELAERSQQLLPAGERAIRSVNAMIIGSAYAELGDLPAAEAAFQQTYDDGVAGGNLYAAIYGPINLILIAMIRGQLAEALHLCEANINRFNQLTAGQNFPPIGALYVLKGCLSLEQNRPAEAEQELTQGLSLVRWTGEVRTHVKGYCALARLRAMQGDTPAMLESLQGLEAVRPETVLLATTLRHRYLARNWGANRAALDDARLWAVQPALRSAVLSEIAGVDYLDEIRFQTQLGAAHVLTRLAAIDQQTRPLPDLHQQLARQERLAESGGLLGWLVEIRLALALMLQVEGDRERARRMLEAALAGAAPRGFFRIFLDESDLLRPLLEDVAARLQEPYLAAFAARLLAAMPTEAAGVKAGLPDPNRLSDRELDVLRLLAAGQSYKEIGQQLFLSLNTVQFHVKSIYSKLQVNKRVQAVEKARELRLI